MTEPVVTVRGEARLRTPPDLAEFSISVVANENSQERVGSSLAEADGRVRAELNRFAAAIDTSHTSGFNIAPVFSRGETKIRGYRGSFSTSISVSDFAALSGLVVALTSIQPSELYGPWWSLEPDNPIYREARLVAIRDALRRADDYAAAFGAQVVRLIEVSDLDVGLAGGQRQSSMAFAAEAMDAGPSFEFEPAEQAVSGQVTARFAISTPDLSAPALRH